MFLSVVLPVYNEKGNIVPLYKRLKAVLKTLGGKQEIIFVNDGSTDGSFEILQELNKKDSSVKVINFSRNFGHQVSISAGLDHASGEAVVVMDADLQHPPELIPQLIEKFKEGYDIVYTIREDPENISWSKKATARWFYRFINAISEVKIPHNAADYRLMSKRTVEQFRRMPESSRFVRGMVPWLGFSQVGIPVQSGERLAGYSKYSMGKMSKFAFEGISSFSNVPLRVSFYVGLIVSLFCLVYIIYAFYAKFFSGAAIQGWTSLIILILFFGGMQMVFLGIIGSYIGQIYNEVRKRPLYIVSDFIGFNSGESQTQENPPS